MSIYSNIYYKLCESKKQAKNDYKPFSGLHEHHILPKHSGGDDSESNLTYLTVKEHIIAHFLLWKIYKNPNDLRAMKMLGANITPEKRKIIGQWCRDNKIGFHGSSPEDRKIWRQKGLNTQSESASKDTFYYWSTPKGRVERSSLGGKKGSQSQIENQIGIHNPENYKKYASLGGKATKGMICVTNGYHRTRIRPEKLNEFLSKGYTKGFKLFS
jgi:hypothetical protein